MGKNILIGTFLCKNRKHSGSFRDCSSTTTKFADRYRIKPENIWKIVKVVMIIDMVMTTYYVHPTTSAYAWI